MAKLLELLTSDVENSLENLTALLACSKEELFAEVRQMEQQGLHFTLENEHLYVLPELPLLNEKRLAEALKPYHVVVKPVISSTNQYLLENVAHLQKGDLCLAEYQTAGRGRRGRQWISPFAGQIIMSFYWQLDPRKPLDGLSTVIGLCRRWLNWTCTDFKSNGRMIFWSMSENLPVFWWKLLIALTVNSIWLLALA